MKIKSSALSAFSNPRVLAAFVICLAGLTFGFFAFVATASPPVVITVNTLLDETTSGDGLCSLREAITNANDNAQTYPECAAGSGTNAITFSVSGTITLGSTLPAIDDDVTIDGGGQSITVSGNDSVRVMFVNQGNTLTLHNLTIANGFSFEGGGIFNLGGTLNVTNSTFSGNSAGSGGGIYSGGGTLNVINSTFSGNSGGGGIFSVAGTLNVSNSTFIGNSTGDRGGGISNDGTANVTNSTFFGNSATNGGGGIFHNGGTGTLKNNIIVNSTSGGDCSNSGAGTFTADSHNLADDATCGGATVASSAQINLQPLANNGGPTQTIALGSGSVAIDAGDESACAAPAVNEFDQRGVTRPVDGDGDGIAICDIGAYEFEPAPLAFQRATSFAFHVAPGLPPTFIPFEIDLPLSGNPGVECRNSDVGVEGGGVPGRHNIFFYFNNHIASTTDASVSCGTVTFRGQNGNPISVEFDGATCNGQYVTVTLTGIHDVFDQTLASASVIVGLLLGDTTGNGLVNSSDIAQTQSQSGQSLSSSNFRADVTVNGEINSSDISLVQAQSGTGLGTPSAALTLQRTKPAKQRDRLKE